MNRDIDEGWTLEALTGAFLEVMEWRNNILAYCLKQAYAVERDGNTLVYLFDMNGVPQYKLLKAGVNAMYANDIIALIEPNARVACRLDAGQKVSADREVIWV